MDLNLLNDRKIQVRAPSARRRLAGSGTSLPGLTIAKSATSVTPGINAELGSPRFNIEPPRRPILAAAVRVKHLLLCTFLFASSCLAAQPDIITVRQISLELARDIAMKAIETCRASGYNISAVVLDRSGNIQAALRDTLAAPYTLEISERKAGLAILSGLPSGEFRDKRPDIRPELDQIRGLIVMGGGLPIQAGGSQIGAIGVAGAPGSDKDAACAAQALEAVRDRLEFTN
ncbi:MAG: GlcG/HbpS family heme-binding protein [Thiobacillaceae bacterium]